MPEHVARFESLLAHPAPGFICTNCGDETGPRFVAPIQHHLSDPATKAELDWLRTLAIPGIEEAIVFYSRWNGAHLFDGPSEPLPKDLAMAAQCGIRLFPIRKWKQCTEETRQHWLETAEGDDPQGDVVYGPNDFIAVGMPCGAWNSFHLIVRGDLAGRIYFWPWTMPPYEPQDCAYMSFGHMIKCIVENPAHTLSEFLGCYTHYWDGRTNRQWVPDKYVEDIHQLSTDGHGFLSKS